MRRNGKKNNREKEEYREDTREEPKGVLGRLFSIQYCVMMRYDQNREDKEDGRRR